MLHGDPNHLGGSFGSAQDRLFDCALPPASVGLAQDDRRIEDIPGGSLNFVTLLFSHNYNVRI